MSITIYEQKKINDIRVFSVVGPLDEVVNMSPMVPERHMVFATQMEEKEISWQGLNFFDEGMSWYSLVSATDESVGSIFSTSLAKILCCKTFFDHILSRSEKITEVIRIEKSMEKDLIVRVDLDGRFKPDHYAVKTEIGNILVAIDLLILDICLSNYLEVIGELYRNSYSDYTISKNMVEKLRRQQMNFAEDLAKMSFV